MSSIKEIAKKAGLSVATVSHVINGTRQVSEKSRRIVLNVIKETGYKPNYAARMLRTQRSNTVAMLIPKVEQGKPTNIFFMDVLSGAKDYLQDNGYNLIVATYSESNDNDEKDMQDLQILKSQWIDGILVVPSKKKYAQLNSIIESSIPFVLLDRPIPELHCSCVYSDGVRAAIEAVKLFGKVGKKRIGYIGGSINSFTGHDRFKGYQEGLSLLGMEFDESIVHTSEYLTVRSGYEGAQKLMKNNVDAIFVSNDVKTIGVLEYLHNNNIQIPQQVGIIAFENYEWMSVTSPPLTTVKQQPYKMGQCAAQLLLKKIEQPDSREEIVLPTEIILRKSHGNEME